LWKTFQPTHRPTRDGDDISVAKFESAATPHPFPLAAGDQGRPDGPSARVYSSTPDSRPITTAAAADDYAVDQQVQKFQSSSSVLTALPIT